MAETASPATTFNSAAARVQSLSRNLHRAGVPTHLLESSRSWVLLAGTSAYRMWKPQPGHGTQAGWLACSRQLCEEEVRLNRRLASATAQAVLAVRGSTEAPAFTGSGPVIDYAVAMPRIGPAALASLRLAQGALEAVHLAGLAEFVDHFHREAARVRAGAADNGARLVAASVEAVLAGLGTRVPREDESTLVRWLRAESAALAARFDSRLAAGQVRDGHGDLRLNHVAVCGDEARVFGGIEHEPARRWVDVLSDMSGIAVDLMVHGRRDLAFVFLNRYLECSGDYAGMDLLRFYLVHRALLRALDPAPGANTANAAQAVQGGGGVARREHLALALRLAHSSEPRLLVTHGPAGAGKSFAAGLLLERCGAIRVSEDVERQRLLGHAPWAKSTAEERRASPVVDPGADPATPPVGSERRAAPKGSPLARLTHDRLRLEAHSALAAGFPTVVDAECLYRWQRDGLRAVAARLGVPFTLLDCHRPGAAPAAAAVGDGEGEGEILADSERRCVLVLGPGEPLSPATLAARWLAAAAPPQTSARRHP